MAHIDGIGMLVVSGLETEPVSLVELTNLHPQRLFGEVISSDLVGFAAARILSGQKDLNLMVVDDVEQLIALLPVLLEDLMEYVVSSFVLVLQRLLEHLEAFGIGQLILMTQQLTQEISPMRPNTSLDESPVLVSLHERRDAKVHHKEVDELLHLLLSVPVYLFHVGN